MTKSYKLTKQERLSGIVSVENLFTAGKTFNVPPLRILYSVIEGQFPVPVKVLITVPRKKFKRAVDRNRIRRKIREVYRLNKSLLYNKLLNSKSAILLGIIYTGEDADPDINLIEDSLIQCLEKLGKKLLTDYQRS